MLETCVCDAALVQVHDSQVAAEWVLALDELSDCLGSLVAHFCVAFEAQVNQAFSTRRLQELSLACRAVSFVSQNRRRSRLCISLVANRFLRCYFFHVLAQKSSR